MDLLAHPFRLVGGRAAVVTDGEDEELAQEIAILATTKRGERSLAPEFGLSDPAFDGVELEELQACLSMWLPGVEVTDVETAPAGDMGARVTITFERVDSELVGDEVEPDELEDTDLETGDELLPAVEVSA